MNRVDSVKQRETSFKLDVHYPYRLKEGLAKAAGAASREYQKT